MTIADVQSVMNFFLDCVLNVWNTIRQANTVLFAMLVTLCLYPVLRRIIRGIRGGK